MKYTEYKNDYYNNCSFIKDQIDDKLIDEKDISLFQCQVKDQNSAFRYDKQEELDFMRKYNT